jgi:hypothetical protein
MAAAAAELPEVAEPEAGAVDPVGRVPEPTPLEPPPEVVGGDVILGEVVLGEPVAAAVGPCDSWWPMRTPPPPASNTATAIAVAARSFEPRRGLWRATESAGVKGPLGRQGTSP